MHWYAGWVRRLAEKYARPIHEIEQMPLSSFYTEIAIMLADVIIQEARRLGGKTSDKKEHRARQAEFGKLKKSTDAFDKLIVERIMLDKKKA